MTRVGGIVLCGGKSSRMGRPKAWLPFGDETLLQRVVRILSEVVEPVVVVAAADQDLPPLPRAVLVARDDREYLGPLSGLATGLAALDGRADVAYLSSCDVPFLRATFVRRVVENLGDADVCLPEVGGFQHPLAAAYRVSVLPKVRELIAANRLRPVFVTEMVPTRVLGAAELAEEDLGSLRNLNTPEEYLAALREAGYAPAGPA
ncbi:MAG: molybdenum cofactor guanylyltransferase [Zavarzinella sp.]|nr:molybdenum cofactor guanylyltransferase [Zavarzinella sp.]